MVEERTDVGVGGSLGELEEVLVEGGREEGVALDIINWGKEGNEDRNVALTSKFLERNTGPSS